MSDTIYYVVYDPDQHSFVPEINTGGYNKLFPKGYHLTCESYYDDSVHERYVHFKSNNEKKAKIKYLKLKIEDMEETGFSHFMPITFNRDIVEYNVLVEKYPELK